VLLEILKAHSDVMLVPLSVNLGYDDPSLFETAGERIRALIKSNLSAESDYMSVDARWGRITPTTKEKLYADARTGLKSPDSSK
jgi:hypothetical protein